MKSIDYSNFGRFCYCAYRGLQDIKSVDYHLGKHCINMSYEQMAKFYYRFKDAAQYICNLDSFLFHLKWFDEGPGSDLIREAVFADAFGSDRMIKEKYADILYSRYKNDIDEFIREQVSSEDMPFKEHIT